MDYKNSDLDEPSIEEQIERCRRLASETVDDELRHSLEELACEYEGLLAKRSESFMLQDRGERGSDAR